MAYNYMNILGIYYPTIEAYCHGDPTNYSNITWISPPVNKSILENSWDSGGNIELQAIPIFTEFEYAESVEVSSTNSTSWASKVLLSFTLVQAATVLFRQTANVRVGTSSRQVITRLLLDSSIVINNTNCLLSSSDRQIIDSISRKYALSSGAHTLDLQYCRGSSSTSVYIENAAISVIKSD